MRGCRNNSARHRVFRAQRTRRPAGLGPDDATVSSDAARRSSPQDTSRTFLVRSCCERFGRNRRGERDDDELVGALVEHEFESADVAAIDLLRERSILLVFNLDAARRTRPRHGRQVARRPRVRWRYSNGPCVRQLKRSQRSPGCTPLNTSCRRGVCHTSDTRVAGPAFQEWS
jgi:hypothetical protein